jgi:hypothetical protein
MISRTLVGCANFARRLSYAQTSVTFRDPRPSLLTKIVRFPRDTRGASATIFALVLPVLIGFECLGALTGIWYMVKRRTQFAADAAAIAAAYETIAGGTDIGGQLTAAAIEAAEQNGYQGAIPTITYPYSDSMVGNGIAVILQQSLASTFLPDVTMVAKAVAVFEPLDNPCLLALAENGTGVEVNDFVSLQLSACSLAANSTSSVAIDIHPSVHSVTADTLLTPGEISFNGGPLDPTALPSEFVLTLPLMIGSSEVKNPYAQTLTHAFLGGSIPGGPEPTNTWIAVTETINSGLYNGGMSIGSGAVIDLTPGAYYVTNGNLTIASGATVTCKTCDGVSGVTIILTTNSAVTGVVGTAMISSGATVTLQPPRAGPFSGFLLLQDPLAISAGGDKPDNALVGGPTMNLTGLLYFPTTTVAFQGNPQATCTLLIAQQITIDGDSRLTTLGCAMVGLTGMPTVYTAVLVE